MFNDVFMWCKLYKLCVNGLLMYVFALNIFTFIMFITIFHLIELTLNLSYINLDVKHSTHLFIILQS